MVLCYVTFSYITVRTDSHNNIYVERQGLQIKKNKTDPQLPKAWKVANVINLSQCVQLHYRNCIVLNTDRWVW